MDKDDLVEITDLTPAERLSKALERRKAQQFAASNPLLSAEVPRDEVVPESAPRDQADATADATAAATAPEYIARKVDSPYAEEARIPLWRHRLPFTGDHPAAKLLERLAVRVYGQPGGSPAAVLRRKRRIELSLAMATGVAILIPLAAVVSQIRAVDQRSTEVESRAIDRITDDLIVTELGPQNANIVGAPPAAQTPAPSAVTAGAAAEVDYPDEYLQLVRSVGGVDQRRSDRAQAVAEIQAEQDEYRLLREAVAAAPNDMHARLVLARWLFSHGWLQEAIAQFKILEAAKALGDDRLNYARALIRMAEPRVAEDLLTSILMQNKANFNARMILMRLYQSQGESGAVKQLADDGLAVAKNDMEKAAINNFLLSPPTSKLADDIPARQAPIPAADDTKVGG